MGAEAVGHERATQERRRSTATRRSTSRSNGSAARSRPSWAEYQNNPARTGLSAEELAAGALTESWSVDLAGQILFASPSSPTGASTSPFDNGRLNALDLDDGSTLWTFTTGAAFRSTPAVVDGRVYVGGGDSGSSTRSTRRPARPIWAYATGDRLTYTAPTVVDGTVTSAPAGARGTAAGSTRSTR